MALASGIRSSDLRNATGAGSARKIREREVVDEEEKNKKKKCR
jgi:hypothetical protein